MLLRAATLADSGAICTIFNEAIVDRVATLETELRTPAEREEWMRARSPRHPVFVIEIDGVVVAWASLNPFNPRRVYDHVADFSVYVARAMRGHHLGQQLLTHLLSVAPELGYHKLVLAALPTNEAGMRLYRRCGFREVGVYREQGVLDGRWIDVVVMEKLLS